MLSKEIPHWCREFRANLWSSFSRPGLQLLRAVGATYTSLVSSVLKRKDGLRFGGEAVTSRGLREPEPVAVLLYGQLASTNARSITIEPSVSSITRALTRTKSGLNLAVRDTEPAGKRNVRHQAQPAPAPAEIPGDVSYNENL